VVAPGPNQRDDVLEEIGRLAKYREGLVRFLLDEGPLEWVGQSRTSREDLRAAAESAVLRTTAELRAWRKLLSELEEKAGTERPVSIVIERTSREPYPGDRPEGGPLKGLRLRGEYDDDEGKRRPVYESSSRGRRSEEDDEGEA